MEMVWSNCLVVLASISGSLGEVKVVPDRAELKIRQANCPETVSSRSSARVACPSKVWLGQTIVVAWYSNSPLRVDLFHSVQGGSL